MKKESRICRLYWTFTVMITDLDKKRCKGYGFCLAQIWVNIQLIKYIWAHLTLIQNGRIIENLSGKTRRAEGENTQVFPRHVESNKFEIPAILQMISQLGLFCAVYRPKMMRRKILSFAPYNVS